MTTLNAVTIDLEDWYHGIEQPFESWGQFSERIDVGTDVLLAILDESDTKATFFVLGWLAEQRPDLIRRIADTGHEIASHGYDHKKLYDSNPSELRQALERAKKATEDIIGKEVIGHRAPYFTLTKKSLWAIDILADSGFRYDASIYPGENWRYGIPNTPDKLYELGDSGIVEFPVSTFELFRGRRVGIGGAYFRILPLWFTTRAVQERISKAQTTNFYLHPWEFDPKHPIIRFRYKAMLTHYFNLGSTAPRFRKLMQSHPFDTMRAVIEQQKSQQGNFESIYLSEH